MRGRGELEAARAGLLCSPPHSSETPHFAPRAHLLPTPRGAEGGQLWQAPAACQPEGSPPPRGGRRECRLLSATAPAPPRHLEQAGEAAARAPGNRRGSLGGPQGQSQETILRKKLGRRTSWANLGDLSGGGVEGTPTHFYQDSGGRGDGDRLGDHVRRPRHREWGWGGDGDLDMEGRSFRAARLSSGSGQRRPRCRQHGIRGYPRRYHPPPALGPCSTGRTELWLGPPGRHPTVTGSLSTPSVLPLILQG